MSKVHTLCVSFDSDSLFINISINIMAVHEYYADNSRCYITPSNSRKDETALGEQD